MQGIKIIQLPPERWKEYKDLRLEMLLSDPQAFGKSYEKSLNGPDSLWEERLRAAQKKDKLLMLFAESNRKLIGMIGAYFNFDTETKNAAKIFGVYVNKDFQGKGVAKSLQEELLKRIWVQVNNSQPAAVKLYEQGNFKTTKKERMILGDGKEYEVDTMEQNLN